MSFWLGVVAGVALSALTAGVLIAWLATQEWR